jgi:predicted nucleic-acid-binding protein
MIGLDTNVLVRYLTFDDPEETTKAVELIDSLSVEARGFLSLVVLVESVWVLESFYRFSKDETIATLDWLLRSKELLVEQADTVWQSLREFKTNRAGFADCLIAHCATEAGCRHTMTFDRKAATLPSMRLLH